MAVNLETSKVYDRVEYDFMIPILYSLFFVEAFSGLIRKAEARGYVN